MAKDPQNEEGQGSTPANYPALVEVVIGAALRSLSSQVGTLYDQLKSANETEQHERRERQATELYWNRTRAKTAIGFSIVSLFLSALTLTVLYKTLGLYRGQATIVSTQATILSKQHEITEKTFSAIQTQATAARLSAQAAKSQAESSKEQAESSKVQADAAALSARNTRDMLRVTEAADVNLQAIECSPSASFGLNTMMTLHYRNSGRTRADNVQSAFSFGIPGALSNAEPTAPTGELKLASIAAGASIPSGKTATVGELLAKSLGDVPPEQALEKIASGQLKFGFWGYVEYTDVLNETHRKTFQYVWDRNFPNACLFTVVSTSGQ